MALPERSLSPSEPTRDASDGELVSCGSVSKLGVELPGFKGVCAEALAEGYLGGKAGLLVKRRMCWNCGNEEIL